MRFFSEESENLLWGWGGSTVVHDDFEIHEVFWDTLGLTGKDISGKVMPDLTTLESTVPLV